MLILVIWPEAVIQLSAAAASHAHMWSSACCSLFYEFFLQWAADDAGGLCTLTHSTVHQWLQN
jgi:hypothetical protein